MKKDLTKTNHRHEGIAEWLVANPDKTLTECAKEFNYTQAWLSRIVHSDLFQAYYRMVCDERKEIAVHTISSKMNYAANLALDQTIAILEDTETRPSERFIIETGGGLLEKLGYGGKAELHVHQHEEKHVHLTEEQLTVARDRANEILKVRHATT